MAADQKDEQAIREVEEAYDRAWRAADLDGILALLAEDAVIVNPLGEVASGHGQIRAMLARFLAGRAKGSTHVTSISRVSLVGRDVAVVDGTARLHSANDDPLVTHGFTDILVRSGDSWRIAHVRAYPLIDKDPDA